MANLSANRSVELIALATNDTDFIPAINMLAWSGLQVALITVPGYQPVPELARAFGFQAKYLVARLRRFHHTDITPVGIRRAFWQVFENEPARRINDLQQH
jgi:hypothetical protein